MVSRFLFDWLLSRSPNWRHAALALMLSPWAIAQDFDGSAWYASPEEAGFACQTAAIAWDQNGFGVTGTTCVTGSALGSIDLVVSFSDAGSVQQTFFWDVSGRSNRQIQSDLDDLTTLTVAINTDLTTAETNITNLQTTVSTNETNIAANTALNQSQQVEIDANTVSAAAHETRLNGIDSTLVTIDGELVDLSNTDALIASDVGVLQAGQGALSAGINFNSNNIAANELYIQGVEAEQQMFESVRAASDAQTNSELQTANANLETISSNTTISNSLQQEGNANQTVSNAILTELSNRQFNTSVDLYTIAADQNLLLQELSNRQFNTSADMYATSQAEQALLTQIRDAQTTIDITGENITIDNTGVENRLDTLNNTMTTPISAPANTQTTVATYQDAFNNFKTAIDAAPISQMANGIATAFASPPPGNCPMPTFDLTSFFDTSITVTEHCNLKTAAAPIITPLMTLLWSLLGIRMILSA